MEIVFSSSRSRKLSDSEELPPNGNGAGLDAKVSLFLRQEISHYLSAERSMEPESEVQATNTIPFAAVPIAFPWNKEKASAQSALKRMTVPRCAIRDSLVGSESSIWAF